MFRNPLIQMSPDELMGEGMITASNILVNFWDRRNKKYFAVPSLPNDVTTNRTVMEKKTFNE